MLALPFLVLALASPSPNPTATNPFALVPLPSGDLLAPGGVVAGTLATNQVDLFSLASHTFAETGPMPVAHRYHHLAVLLGNGKLLIAGEQYGGYTRWQLDGSGTSVVAISPAMLALPSGLNDAGGASLYAIVQHELGHSVGLQHSPNSADVMYFQANPKTPNVYSAADTALLAKTLCRS